MPAPKLRMGGAREFVEHFRRDLGLTTNEYGRPTVREAQCQPQEFSLRGLAESLCGHEWVENLQQDQRDGQRVFEQGGNAAIHPGNIPNVSAYLGSVAGLLDAAILQGYERPDYLIDKLIYTQSSRQRQQRLIGLGRMGDKAKRRMPGDPHPFAQIGERTSITPETQNDALACAVTFEAVFFDQTGQVLEQANNVGDELAFRKELDGFRLIAGVTNPYNYNGVAYNTYLTSGNWINDIASNEMVNWTNLDIANALLGRMTDQETGNRIVMTLDTILVSPAKKWSAGYIRSATEQETQTASGAEIRRGPTLAEQFKERYFSSPILDQILTTAAADGGLALTQSQADGYWFALKTGPNGAFVRIENWGIQINRATPNDFTMLNHKLLLAVFSDYMHAFAVREPRAVIRSRKP